MTRSLLVGLIAGFILGFGVASLAFLSRRAPEPAPKKPDPVVRAPEKPAPPEPVKEAPRPEEPTKPDPEPVKPVPKVEEPAVTAEELAAKFAKLAEKGVGAYGSKDLAALAELLRKAGKAGLDFAIERLLKAESGTDRFVAAALLESLGDPAALPALGEALAKDDDELVRRMASHAMALIGTEGAVSGLRSAMQGDQDWGVRINSAYGLAKLGQDDGLKMMEQAYLSQETPAEARGAVLGGLADVAHPSTAPIFRQMLASTEAGYQLLAIQVLQKMKDTSSLADLQKLAGAAKSQAVRTAAAKAVEEIQK